MFGNSDYSGILLGFLLVLTRVGSFFAFLPIPGGRSFPGPAKIVLSLATASMLMRFWPAAGAAVSTTDSSLLATLAAEAVFGIGAGLCASILIEVSQLWAQFLGVQAGFSYASTIDPNSEADSTILLILFQLAASLIVFATGLDRLLLASLAASFERFPPGSLPIDRTPVVELIGTLGSAMFQLSFRLALPVTAVLLAADLTLALLGKIEQHLQLSSLLFPVKTLIALAVAAATLGSTTRLLGQWFQTGWSMVERVLLAPGSAGGT